MTDFSLKEFEALCQRAARGAYMPWGLAEDAARAVCWLESISFPSVSQFVGLLQRNDGVEISKLAIRPLNDGILGKAKTGACPILTGSYLSDAHQTLDFKNGVQIEQVAYPCFLLPFLSAASATRADNLTVSWGNFEAKVSELGVQILSGETEFGSAQSEMVYVVRNNTSPQRRASPVSRLQVASDNLTILTELAVRTYLPETALSKATGAGGGSVDDD